jgi:hypothetical protein
VPDGSRSIDESYGQIDYGKGFQTFEVKNIQLSGRRLEIHRKALNKAEVRASTHIEARASLLVS